MCRRPESSLTWPHPFWQQSPLQAALRERRRAEGNPTSQATGAPRVQLKPHVEKQLRAWLAHDEIASITTSHDLKKAYDVMCVRRDQHARRQSEADQMQDALFGPGPGEAEGDGQVLPELDVKMLQETLGLDATASTEPGVGGRGLDLLGSLPQAASAAAPTKESDSAGSSVGSPQGSGIGSHPEYHRLDEGEAGKTAVLSSEPEDEASGPPTTVKLAPESGERTPAVSLATGAAEPSVSDGEDMPAEVSSGESDTGGSSAPEDIAVETGGASPPLHVSKTAPGRAQRKQRGGQLTLVRASTNGSARFVFGAPSDAALLPNPEQYASLGESDSLMNRRQLKQTENTELRLKGYFDERQSVYAKGEARELVMSTVHAASQFGQACFGGGHQAITIVTRLPKGIRSWHQPSGLSAAVLANHPHGVILGHRGTSTVEVEDVGDNAPFRLHHESLLGVDVSAKSGPLHSEPYTLVASTKDWRTRPLGAALALVAEVMAAGTIEEQLKVTRSFARMVTSELSYSSARKRVQLQADFPRRPTRSLKKL